MALATTTTPGSIILGGDLTGVANAPELRITGVTAGNYVPQTIVVDAKGRLIYVASTGGITLTGALSGVISSSSAVTTLAASGVAAGTYTFPQVTVNDGGLVTAASSGSSPTLTGQLSGTISATVLSNTGVTAGTYSNAAFTVNAAGKLTSATNGAVTVNGEVNGSVSNLALNASGVTPGTYTFPTITVDAKGRITSAASGSLTFAGDMSGTSSATVLSNSGVTAGTYAYATLTVNNKGRVTAAADNTATTFADATTTTKGILQISADQGLTITGGVLSGTLPTGTTAFGVVKSANTTNLSITAGVIDVGTNIPKLAITNTWAAATTDSIVSATGTVYPNLTTDTILNLSGSWNIAAPANALTGSQFSIVSRLGNIEIPTLLGAANHDATGPVAYNGSLYVCAGGSGPRYSADGINWTGTSYSIGNSLWNIIWNGSIFCALPRFFDGVNTKASISSDGINWTGHTLPFSGTSTADDTKHMEIAWNGSVFCILPKNGDLTKYATSPDGINWTLQTFPTTIVILPYDTMHIAAGNGKFCISCSVPTPAADTMYTAASTDGINWTVGSYTASGAGGWGAWGIAYGNNEFYLNGVWGSSSLGANRLGRYTSTTGTSWTGGLFLDTGYPTQVNGAGRPLWIGTKWLIGNQYLGYGNNVLITPYYTTFLDYSSITFDPVYKFSNNLVPSSYTGYFSVDCTVIDSTVYCTYVN